MLPSMPSSSARQDFTKSKFPLEVWYDPCKPVMQCKNIADETERLLITFSGKVKQDMTASNLINSGATHNFVDASYAKKAKLHVTPETGQVACARDTSASVQGYAHVRLNLQSFHGVIKMYIIDLPQDSSMDMILGQVWLKDHQASLDYANQCVRYFMDGRRLSLAGQEQSVMTDSCMTIPVLNFTQFKKETRKKCNAVFTVFVHCVQTDDAGEIKSPHGQAQPLVEEYNTVFQEMPPGLPPKRNIGHTINTGDHLLVSKPSYRLNPKEKAEVERQVKDLLAKGLIRQCHSPYGSPVLFVQKKDGSLRMCVDYRALNNITVKDKYPLPRIDDLFDRLKGAQVFSSLDLQSGYHQIQIAEQDVQKTAFRTHEGLYEFMVLPFGLTNAPAAFQREMQAIFDHLPFVLVYLDDILVFSSSKEVHQGHLRKVLELLKEHKLYAKLSKCSFFDEEAKFLGHTVSKGGIHTDPDKISTIVNWPAPTNVTEMKQFLGLGNHLKRFIKDYSLLTMPLNDLTKPSDAYDFSSNAVAQQAFAKVKIAMSTAPVLAIADEHKPYELVCDACGYRIGAVLMQDAEPIAFFSYNLNSAERNYPTGEQELLAVVKSLEHWRYYLEGCKGRLTVVTDHKPNTFLNSKPPTLLSRRQVRWQAFLSRLDFEWEYRKGAYNIADPLSRNPALLSMQASQAQVSQSPKDLSEVIKQSYAQDPWFHDPSNLENLVYDDGFYKKGTQVLVPCDSQREFRELCISMHHNPPYAGHLGRDRTLEQVRRHFVWPGMRRDIADYVARCYMCQRSKAANQAPAGLLVPLQIPEGLWESVSMDLITHLPETKDGNSAIIVFVDRLSKMVRIIPAKTSIDAKEYAYLFVREIFAKHGLPKPLVSDRDPRFTSDFFQQVREMARGAWPGQAARRERHKKSSRFLHPARLLSAGSRGGGGGGGGGERQPGGKDH